MLASSIGGYLAGRLRTKWIGVHSHEVYFRDTAHGFLAWAVATVLGVAVLSAAATHIVAGASAGLTQIAATTQAAGPMEGYLDALLRADPAPNRNPADLSAIRNEFGRLLASALNKNVELSAADRTYMARVVAARTGLSQADIALFAH
jgi:hypothetical protein